MRPLRSTPSLLIQFLVINAISACSGPQIAQRELPVAARPPLPRPEVYLYVDHFPREPEGTDGVAFTLPLVKAGYQSHREDGALAQDLTYTLDFQAPLVKGKTPPPLHRVAIIAGEKMVPLLSRNQVYSVTYYYHDKGIFLPPSLGLVIKDVSGRVLYLLSADEAVPGADYPATLSVRPAQKTAFNTTRVTAAGCTIFKRHHFVEFQTANGDHSCAPGVPATLSTPDGLYRVTLFDYSVSDTEVDCLVEDPPHFSFLLEWLDEP